MSEELKNYCEVILTDSEKSKAELKKILTEHKLSIPILLKSEWER
ncbi:MAG: hypothetical protein US35_C0004G0016 [Parcubacteria group bacterium GW2011_GWA2_37_10]|nr:MAG: hypothetical protein US35_C0004G0016 [Parcubacteria group bacterium GW2011_GWA2_37_10]